MRRGGSRDLSLSEHRVIFRLTERWWQAFCLSQERDVWLIQEESKAEE